jgi:hypothetical protein
VSQGAVKAKAFLLSPDYLMNYARDFQAKAEKLQDEFDQAYLAANGVISQILGGTMVNKLNVYKNHTDDLLGYYVPIFESLAVLPIDDCRNNVVVMLQAILGTAGNQGGLCSKNYHTDTKKAANGVTDNINGLNQYYIELSRFVYHSFSASNALVDSEEILKNINSTYTRLADKLQFDAVDTDAFKATLAALDKKFKDCLDSAEGYVSTMMEMTRAQVDVCKDLHDVSRASRGVRTTQFRSYMPEFEAAMNSYEEYKW